MFFIIILSQNIKHRYRSTRNIGPAVAGRLVSLFGQKLSSAPSNIGGSTAKPSSRVSSEVGGTGGRVRQDDVCCIEVD